MKADGPFVLHILSVGVDTSSKVSDLVLSSLSTFWLSGVFSPDWIFILEGENLWGLYGVWDTRSLSWFTLIGLKFNLSWAD